MSTCSIEPLVVLAIRQAAHQAPIESLFEIYHIYPHALRRILLQNLSPARLRALEQQIWSLDAENGHEEGGWQLEQELQRIWKKRCREDQLLDGQGYSMSQFKRKTTVRALDYRQKWCEYQVRAIMRDHGSSGVPKQQPINSRDHVNASESDGSSQVVLPTAMAAYEDCVRVLKLHGREITRHRVALVVQLSQLRRLEIHHPEQRQTCWQSMAQVIGEQRTLREFCFFHGRLTEKQLEVVRRVLVARMSRETMEDSATSNELEQITTLEFVSVQLRCWGYRELITLLREYVILQELRLTNCISDFQNDQLLRALVNLPKLRQLRMEHNDLEDANGVFASLDAPTVTTIPWRYLQLGHNALTTHFMDVICKVLSDGKMPHLVRLELAHNNMIRNGGVRVLASLFDSPLAALRHVNLSACGIDVNGAKHLLASLQTSRTLTYLDVSCNSFGCAFGDVLGDFLAKDSPLTSLCVNSVDLGIEGCTQKLINGLEQNSHIVMLNLGGNRLRDTGMKILFPALLRRSQRLPFEALYLNGNLLKYPSLRLITDGMATATQETQDSAKGAKCLPLIKELCLTENYFLNGEDDEKVRDTVVELSQYVTTLYGAEFYHIPSRTIYDDEI